MSKTFHSLKYVNFRLWFGGNIIASTGSWMQRVAQDWLVLTVLTDNSALQLGIVTALQFVPMLLLSPWAGVVADRVNRRHLLQITQALTGLFGVVLGVLVLSGVAQLWMVYILALAGGIVSTLDSPARQAFVSELVPVTSLTNAIGLNSMAFNIARLLGPAVSGLVIAAVGPGWVFVINGALFLAPVIAMASMRVPELIPLRQVPRRPGQVREGLRYVKSRPDIILILCVVFVVSALGMNFQMTSALMATEVYGKGAGEYGILGSFMAIGALGGALLAARRAMPRLRWIVFSAGAFGLAELALGAAPGYWPFAILAIPTGLAMLTMVTSANALVQITTPEEMRGRVMAIYSMIFMGATPIGSPIIGWVGEHWGARWSLWVGGIASLVVAVVALVWAKVHWEVRVRLHWSFTHPIEDVSRIDAAAGADSTASIDEGASTPDPSHPAGPEGDVGASGPSGDPEDDR